MRVWTLLLSLVLAALVAGNVSAQEKKPRKERPVAERFEKMDTNKDGIVTEQEFAAGHPKLDADKAKKMYEELAKLGGTTTKGGATGMTLEQFKKAREEWRKSHPRKGHDDKK